MAYIVHTTEVVPPSDEVCCERRVGTIKLESRRPTNEESELVCEVPQSQDCAPAQEENISKATTTSTVYNGCMTKRARLNDGNSSRRIQDTCRNQTPHSTLNLCHYHIIFGHIIKKFIILLLLSSFNVVSGNQNCNRVLAASDVKSKSSNNLDFSHGQYKEIEEGAFADSEAAERFDVSQNCLQYVPKDAFDNMTNVFSVNMARNDFSSYPSALRKSENLKNLEHLNFMDNEIDYLGQDYFKRKEKLSVLNFARNRIESVHTHALDPLSALRSANFSENLLTSLPCLNITKLRNLRNIYFKNNILRYLNIEHFSNFPEVTNISITDDKMTLERNDTKDMVFWITGNSETLSCEVSKHDIEHAKIRIEYNFTCKNGSNISQVLKGSRLPQSGLTIPVPDVTNMSTPFPCTNDKLPGIVGLSVALVVVVLVEAVVIVWLGTKHYKRKVGQLRVGVSSTSNGTDEEAIGLQRPSQAHNEPCEVDRGSLRIRSVSLM